MKTSKIVAMASLAATIAMVIGMTVNFSKSTTYTPISESTQAPDPVTTASLEPVVVTAKR